MPRHFVSQNDLSPNEVREIFAAAGSLKITPIADTFRGRSLVMYFEKSSTRTRLSFEIGMTQLGGHAVYVDPATSQLSRGESVEDTARVASRYADLIMARVNAHLTVTTLASSADVPVINGLSDEEHPCQSLTDMFTILEHKHRLEGLRLAYLGDGNNNVTHSLMLAATQLGIDMRIACPEELSPNRRYHHLALQNAAKHGGSVTVTTDPAEGIEGADVVYADTWVSMGREADTVRRLQILKPYQVNAGIVRGATDDFIFMHCLPAHIGDEVTSDVAYGPHSVIFDEAENRLHVQKALMVFLMQSGEEGA